VLRAGNDATPPSAWVELFVVSDPSRFVLIVVHNVVVDWHLLILLRRHMLCYSVCYLKECSLLLDHLFENFVDLTRLTGR
jgi:hypothetical protein